MNNREFQDAMATVVKKTFTLFDAGLISADAAKALIASMVEAADNWTEEPDQIFNLVPDRCTVCLQQREDSELVDWMDVPPEQPLTSEQEKAQRNSFSEEMVGAKVCRACLHANPGLV